MVAKVSSDFEWYSYDDDQFMDDLMEELRTNDWPVERWPISMLPQELVGEFDADDYGDEEAWRQIDTALPIIVFRDRNGRAGKLDGFHRMVRRMNLGRKTAPVIVVPTEVVTRLVKENDQPVDAGFVV